MLETLKRQCATLSRNNVGITGYSSIFSQKDHTSLPLYLQSIAFCKYYLIVLLMEAGNLLENSDLMPLSQVLNLSDWWMGSSWYLCWRSLLKSSFLIRKGNVHHILACLFLWITKEKRGSLSLVSLLRCDLEFYRPLTHGTDES